MKDVFIAAKAIVIFFLRILVVPTFFMLSAMLTLLVKAVYWVWTRGRTDVVLLWVPPWQRNQYREALNSSQQPGDHGKRAAEIFPDLFALERRGWLAAIRRRRYRPPVQGEPLCRATENAN